MNSNEQIIRALALEYFEAFSSKDLLKLESMFANDVILRDWETSALGRGQVILANQKIFNSLSTVSVRPINIFVSGHVVIGELEIVINGEEIIIGTNFIGGRFRVSLRFSLPPGRPDFVLASKITS